MRKPVYLAVVGISIVVAAVSLGVTLTRCIGLRAYSPRSAARSAPAPAGDDVRAAPPEQWTNIFAPRDGMALASRLPAADAKTASRATRTDFVLVGTIVSSTPSASRAVLWANGMKEPQAFREKEEVEPGAVLSSIERDKVWITRGNEREKLEILPVGSRGRTAAGPGPSGVSPPPAARTAVPARAYTPPRVAPGPRPVPGGRVIAPNASPGDEDEEELSPRERRRRRRSRAR